MNKKLLSLLVCPACKGALQYQKELKELWCRADKKAFAIRNDIPVMLVEEARSLSLEELDHD